MVVYIIGICFFVALTLFAFFDTLHAYKHRKKQIDLLDLQFSILLDFANKNEINI